MSLPRLSAADEWFVDNGLPWFADPVRAQVQRRLSVPRLGSALVMILALGVASGWGLATWWGVGSDVEWAAVLSFQSMLVLGACYAFFALRAGMIVRWALRRTLGSLGLLYPLVARALPMLLLFITFLFINAEVWQVAAHLNGTRTVYVVMTFATMASCFLMARLPEIVDELDEGLDADRVARACEGSPLSEVVHLDESPGIDEPLVGLERANLLLVLLVSQAIQVLLLAVSILVFFLLFGALTIDPAIIKNWAQQPADLILGDRISMELVKVSVFLASFSGLYFTVTAVSDDVYRREFFTAVTDELERAVAVREVYRAVHRHRSADSEAPPAEGHASGPTA